MKFMICSFSFYHGMCVMPNMFTCNTSLVYIMYFQNLIEFFIPILMYFGLNNCFKLCHIHRIMFYSFEGTVKWNWFFLLSPFWGYRCHNIHTQSHSFTITVWFLDSLQVLQVRDEIIMLLQIVYRFSKRYGAIEKDKD